VLLLLAVLFSDLWTTFDGRDHRPSQPVVIIITLLTVH